MTHLFLTLQIGHDFTGLPPKSKIDIPGLESLRAAQVQIDQALQWTESRRSTLMKRMEDNIHALDVLESLPLNG
jgi:hypothetical protein